MKKCIDAIDSANRLFAWISGLCVAAAALLIIAEIASRVVLGQSLQVTDEYTGYLMAVSSFFGLGYVGQTHGHIRMGLIDLLRKKCPTFIRACRIWAYGVTLVFAGYLACAGWKLFYQSYVYGSKSMQISETPLVIPQLFIPLGAAVLFLQYLCNMYKYCSGQSDK
jgi:TRAP-type C4-dicarboxylate transport system permease small subunit